MNTNHILSIHANLALVFFPCDRGLVNMKGCFGGLSFLKFERFSMKYVDGSLHLSHLKGVLL